MKKILLSCVLMTLCISCVKDRTHDIAPIAPGTLSVSFADEDTKVQLDNAAKTVWNADDRVSVFYYSDANDCWKFMGATGDRVGNLKRELQGSATTTIDKVVVVYPYSDGYTLNAEKQTISANIPATQHYTPDSYGVGANIMVSTGTTDSFAMKNLCGWLKLQLSGGGKTVTKITLHGNANERLAGRAVIDYATPSLTLSDVAMPDDNEVGGTLVSDDENAITLDCGDGVALSETPASFYFALAPQTFDKGITITVTYSDGTTSEKSTANAITITRNHITPMADVIATIPHNQIWYTSTNDNIVNPNSSADYGVNIVSNTYENGRGIITFDGNVTKIGEYAFIYSRLKSIVIPDSVTKIDELAFYDCTELTSATIGDGVTTIGNSAFCECTGLTSVTIPDSVTTIDDSAFRECTGLTSVVIGNGVTRIGDGAFSGCTSLTNVTIPDKVEYIHAYAFNGCSNIEHFYGNKRFVSDDNLCLFGTNPNSGQINRSYLISFANGSGLTAYTIPEYVEMVANYAFANNQDIASVTFPDNIYSIGSSAFENCDNLEYIYGKCASEDNKCAVCEGQLQLFAGKGIRTYTTPEYVTSIGWEAFACKKDLEEVVLTDNVIGVGGYGYIFNGSKNLKKVTISANMRNLEYDPFGGCDNLTTVYCRAVVPPSLKTNSSDSIDFPNLTIYVPQQSVDKYLASSDWQPYWKYIKSYTYTDLPASDYYISSDYSADGVVKTLQTATIGNGIDIVLMADAYSDRQIVAGDYDKAVQTAYENLFTEEPYKSFRDMFNVYEVTVVSATEGYGHSATALSGYFGSGTLVGGNDTTVFRYAQKAIAEDRMDDALIVVIMNSATYAGTCYMYHPTSGDYGRGTSVAYFPLGTDSQMFAELLHHEACGHGFAKLADEYAYESLGAVPSDVVADANKYAAYGWYKNVDFTNDTSSIKWSRFLSDVRYSYDGLGAYEGGLTYWTGVWRPTENSIMSINSDGFNAPSREAIYYRIHKLAYGESWTYNYEDFVAYDVINRKTSASQSVKSRPVTPKRVEPLAPPVVVEHSWRDAK